MLRERGTVTVWSLGYDRFRVEARGVSHELRGFEAARDLAGRLAAQLGSAADVGLEKPAPRVLELFAPR
jgi:hypothetical protein